MEQIREEFGELSLGTQEGREREKGKLKEAMEGKIEDMERRLAECVETRCEKQGDLLRERGEDTLPRGGSCPGGAGVTGQSKRVARCGGVHAEFGGNRGRGVFWPNAGTRYDCSGQCAE